MKEKNKANKDLETCGILPNAPLYPLWESRSEKGTERLFEEIMAESFPNLMKYVNLQIRELNKFQV